MNRTAHVVGVYYRQIHNAKEVLESLCSSPTQVLLRAEPNNPRDPNAIAVYMYGQKFGYISSSDIASVPIRTGELAISDEVLIAKTTGDVNIQSGSFVVSFTNDHAFRISSLDKFGREWDNWSPKSFDCQQQLTLINDVQAVIDMLMHLSGEMNKASLILAWASGLRQIGCFPLWREAQNDLSSLIATYENDENGSHRNAVQELRHMVSAIGSQKHREAFATEWWPNLLASDEIKQFSLLHNSVPLAAVTEDIMNLPGQLGLLNTDRVSLFSSIYYRRLPQEKWNALILLFALHDILKGGTIQTSTTQYNIGCSVTNNIQS